jgi:hypothetical protein
MKLGSEYMDGGRKKTGAGRHSCSMTAKVLIIDVLGDSARGMHKREPDPWPQQVCIIHT